MRKFFFAATSVLLLPLFLSPINAANFLQNGDFESGTDNWSRMNSNVSFSVVSNPVNGGSGSLSLANTSIRNYGVEQVIPSIAGGTSYFVFGYIYNNDPNTKEAKLRIAWYSTTDGSDDQLSTNDTNSVSSQQANWQTVQGTFTAPANAQSAKIRAVLASKTAGTAATAYFDDLFFQPDFSLPTSESSQTQSSSSLSPGAVILNEFVANPQSGDEWIELKNTTSNTLDLSSYKLADSEGGTGAVNIPQDSTINPHGFYVFSFTSARLNNSGDTVRFLTPDGGLLDSHSYQASQKGVSFAKDQTGNWRETSTVTPGAENIITQPTTNSGSQDHDSTPTPTKSSTQNQNVAGIRTQKTIGGVNETVLSEATQSPIVNLVATESATPSTNLATGLMQKSKSKLGLFLIGGGLLLTLSGVLYYFRNKVGKID